MSEEITKLYSEYKVSRAKLDDKLEYLKLQALKLHPLKLGDKVVVNGWSHTGKEMVIIALDVKEEYDCLLWVARGTLIKKNNELGVMTGDWVKKIGLIL